MCFHSVPKQALQPTRKLQGVPEGGSTFSWPVPNQIQPNGGGNTFWMSLAPSSLLQSAEWWDSKPEHQVETFNVNWLCKLNAL
jgi:hypothetical protein